MGQLQVVHSCKVIEKWCTAFGFNETIPGVWMIYEALYVKSNKLFLDSIRAQTTGKDNEMSELSRITFVFETLCTADCKFYFLVVCKVVVFFLHLLGINAQQI